VSADLPDRAEPFADRARWYPVLAFRGGEVEPDAAAKLFETALDNVGDYDGCPWYEVSILVARRSALPVPSTGLPDLDEDGWRIIGEPGAEDIAFERSAETNAILDVDTARQVWLDAVAVAASRNQRAEAGR
jgi:hypothetical protein